MTSYSVQICFSNENSCIRIYFHVLILDNKYFFMFRFGDPKNSAASTEVFGD